MFKTLRCSLAIVAALIGTAHAAGGNDVPAAPQGVYFVSPADGATVTSPLKVQFGVKGMTVKPAGELADGTGHHHLLINVDSVPKGAVVPADAQHIHFGKGQTETELKFDPGTYRLMLQFADGLHSSYGKDMSAAITVTVK